MSESPEQQRRRPGAKKREPTLCPPYPSLRIVCCVICYGLVVNSSFSGESVRRKVYVARVSFTSMHQAASREGRKRRGASFIDQPIITQYSVQTLHNSI